MFSGRVLDSPDSPWIAECLPSSKIENRVVQLYKCADVNQYCKSMTKPQPELNYVIYIYTNNVDFLSLVRTVLHRIVLFNPGMMPEFSFVMV